jgi:hypothetical protein
MEENLGNLLTLMCTLQFHYLFWALPYHIFISKSEFEQIQLLSVQQLIFFSAESQLWSVPFSFLSLALASNKLFFSQRLGIYSDDDPSFQMSLIVTPFNVCILIGTLYSLVIIATYAHGYVVVLIGTIVLLNLIILKCTYLRKTHKKEIIDIFYNQQKEFGTKETHALFLYALLTSWVSPCTV